jgi:tetratricopeptide (TPR) repeat protein
VYRRNFGKAIETLNRLLQVNPRYYDAYNLLGTVYTEQGNYQQAKEKLLVAANAEEYLTPENAYANLAVLEMKFEKFDDALRHVEKGLVLNRGFAPLYNLKGLALENLGKLNEAAENYDKALALAAAPDPGYLINSARVSTKLGDKKKAVNSLELALGKVNDPAQKAEIIKMIKALEGN